VRWDFNEVRKSEKCVGFEMVRCRVVFEARKPR
jgi:hypothetical protein